MASFPPQGFIATESALDGVTVYMPIVVQEEHQQVVAFRCAQCNGETAFNAADGGITCTYCGYHEAPDVALVGTAAETFEFKVETVAQASHGWGAEREEIVCQTCASHIVVGRDELTTACPFCSSNNVIHHRAPQDVLRPRFLVPFKISEDQCHTNVRDWLGGDWLVPAKLQRLASLGEFAPMYLPYWTFDANADAHWKAEVGYDTSSTDSEGNTYVETEWRWESGTAEHTFKNIRVCGTERLNQKHLDAIQDEFDLEGLVEYNPSFLAGTQAVAYETALEPAWADARTTMRERMHTRCHGQIGGNHVRSFSMELEFDDEAWRYLLLPVYISNYHYENKLYQLLINGQTGLIVGQRPADWRKIGIAAAIPMILGALLVFWELVIAPTDEGTLLAIGAVLVLIGIIAGAALGLRGGSLEDA